MILDGARLREFESRIQRLERSGRRWRAAACAAALVLVAAATVGMAASRPGTIEGREIILRDDQGRARLTLRVSGHGSIVGAFDEQGKPMMGFGAIDGRSNLTLYDGQARPRVGLGFVDTGEPGILVMDATGREVFSKR